MLTFCFVSLFSSVMMSDKNDGGSTLTILILCLILVLLVLLLLYLYKRLNNETKDEYTIQRLVFSEGGLRDRVRQGIAEVQTRIGDRIRSQPLDEEQALSNNEDGNSGREEERDEEEDAGQGQRENENKTEEKEEEHQDHDSSDDYSSIDLRERVKQNNSNEEEMKEDEQEKQEVAKDEGKRDDNKQEEDVKNEERVGLLVDLKAFSGSAIWSEEKKEETNVTAL